MNLSHQAKHDQSFWQDVFSISGTTTPRLFIQVMLFGAFAAFLCILDRSIHTDLGVETTFMEFAGAALGLLLVLRTNEGYGRWWESRKLWGAIVNNSRNIAILAKSYGPNDKVWRADLTRWLVAFAYVCRDSLRGEREFPDLVRLIGPEETKQVVLAPHAPTFVAYRIGRLIERGAELGMESLVLLRMETERSSLIDQVGGCERILKTPLPWVYVVQLRRFMAIYLMTLPLALISKLGWWPTPLVTMTVAYPILGLDRIAVALQNPFSKKCLNHLPLDDITSALERDLLAFDALNLEESAKTY